MNLMWWLYAIDVADGLRWYFTFGAIVSTGTIVITLLVGTAMTDEHAPETTWRLWRYWLCGAFACLSFSVFWSTAIPQTKTMYMMLGARASQEIIENPKIQETGAKVLQLINKKLDEFTVEDKPTDENKK